MPQTIALQRGTTDVIGNGNNSVTLFTQSGGIATRVIVNQLTMYFTGQVSQAIRVGVYHSSSGGQYSLLGFITSATDIPVRAIQFPIATTSENVWNGRLTGTSGQFHPTVPFIRQASNEGNMFATNVNNIQLNYSNNTAGFYSAILPSNFWIGPNDSLAMKIYSFDAGSSALSAYISYSFTTITES